MSANQTFTSAKRVVLVSCVKSKRDSNSAARDLYTSPLFVGMRKFAEKNADIWFILSAKHGVLRPDQNIDPYELTLNKMTKPQRLTWAELVRSQLNEILPLKAKVTILAGVIYREGIVPHLRSNDFEVDIPMEGLGIGCQLQWLNKL